MSDEVKIWAIALISLIIVCALPVSCTVNNTNRKSEAIANGMDAGEASCAFDYSPNRDACLLRAARTLK